MYSYAYKNVEIKSNVILLKQLCTAWYRYDCIYVIKKKSTVAGLLDKPTFYLYKFTPTGSLMCVIPTLTTITVFLNKCSFLGLAALKICLVRIL